MEGFDISRPPRGVITAKGLITFVAEAGDLAERHYLELKSSLNLSQKKDKEKIAKFILGAANRMPDVAQSAFEGMAVMIVGVSKGNIEGIPPVEMMDIAKVVQKFLGANGPRWDVLWVPIDGSTNQILVVLVEPPVMGQGPFLCRANGESLTDGRIYIRGEGETREATSDEVDLLMQRGKTVSNADLDFTVEVLGQIASVECDDALTVEAYLAAKSAELLDTLPKKRLQVEELTKLPHGIEGLNLIYSASDWAAHQKLYTNSLFAEPEDRTEGEYRAAVEDWQVQVRDSWADAKTRIAAGILKPATIRVTNNTSVFLHDVELKLHLEGEISGHDWMKFESISTPSGLGLPAAPRQWGHKKRDLLVSTRHLSRVSQMEDISAMMLSSISYKNEGSVQIKVDIGELRPQEVFESDDKELVLLVGDKEKKTIHGTWEITASGHNNVFSGTIDLVVQDSKNITKSIQSILGIEDEGNNILQ